MFFFSRETAVDKESSKAEIYLALWKQWWWPEEHLHGYSYVRRPGLLFQCSSLLFRLLSNSVLYLSRSTSTGSIACTLAVDCLSILLCPCLLSGTIFAYGQTSSGKTHTMMGSALEKGVIQLSLDEIFNIIAEVSNSASKHTVKHLMFAGLIFFAILSNEQICEVTFSCFNTWSTRHRKTCDQSLLYKKMEPGNLLVFLQCTYLSKNCKTWMKMKALQNMASEQVPSYSSSLLPFFRLKNYNDCDRDTCDHQAYELDPIHEACLLLFSLLLLQSANRMFLIRVSFLEIYNEVLRWCSVVCFWWLLSYWCSWVVCSLFWVRFLLNFVAWAHSSLYLEVSQTHLCYFLYILVQYIPVILTNAHGLALLVPWSFAINCCIRHSLRLWELS